MKQAKKTIKERFKGLGTSQKVLLGICMVILLSGSAFAVFLLYFDGGTSGYTVSSTVPLEFSSALTDTAIDTTTSGYEKTEAITITSNNGNITLEVLIDRVIVDDVDDCDGTSDLNSVVSYLGIDLINEDTIMVEGNTDSNLTITTTAEKFSCSGSISTGVILQGTE